MRRAIQRIRRLAVRLTVFPRARDKPVATAFSEFIRNASAAEKKRVYERVLNQATEQQNRLRPKASPCK